jgi:hypothetical protein
MRIYNDLEIDLGNLKEHKVVVLCFHHTLPFTTNILAVRSDTSRLLVLLGGGTLGGG